MAYPPLPRIGAPVGFVVALCLLGAVFIWGSRSAPAQDPQEPTQLHVNINDDCIGSDTWPASDRVNVEVRDGSGAVVFATRVSADSAGNFIVNEVHGGRCDIPVDLRPGMEVTASGRSTTKVVELKRVTYDELNPDTDMASGIAPAGRLEVVVYSEGRNTGKNIMDFPGGRWSVDFGELGVDVKLGSAGDVLAYEPDHDATVADHFVTAVSLTASVPAGAAAQVGADAAGATVVRRGARVRLAGRLKAGTNACVRRKRVTLLRLRGRKSNALKSARTNRKGRYSFIRKVTSTTRFRVRYAGNSRCRRSESRVRTVRVSGP